MNAIEYRMSDEDMEMMKEACTPRMTTFISGGMPYFFPDDKVINAAWMKLGKKMQFDPFTVDVSTLGSLSDGFFTAVPLADVQHRSVAV